MSDDKNTNEEYKGTGKWASMVGQGYVEREIAGDAALVVGAGVGALAGKSTGKKVVDATARGIRSVGNKINK